MARKQYKVRGEVNRRSENRRTRFPMQMDTGEIVLRERRLSPDRRHPGLQTHEIKISSEEFAELFDVYGKHG